MAETQTWRIDSRAEMYEVGVHRSGDSWVACNRYFGTTPRGAVELYALHNEVCGEILAPGEPTRAELAAQLAAVTAERDGLWTRLGARETVLYGTVARLRDEKAELRAQVDHRAVGDAEQRIAAAWSQIAGHFLVSPSSANAERIANLACAAAEVRDEATRTRDEAVAELQRLRAEHTAALDAARREGAEAMRERAKSALREWVIAGRRGKHASTDTLEAVNMIAVLPLDAPDDALPEHATTPAPVCPAPTEGT